METSTAKDGFWSLALSERTGILKDISRLTQHIESWQLLDSLHNDLKAAAELYKEEEDAEIFKDITKNNGKAVMTSNKHKTGTDFITQHLNKFFILFCLN